MRGRRGDGETGRRRDGETERRGDGAISSCALRPVISSPRLPVPQSPCPSISPSLCLPVPSIHHTLSEFFRRRAVNEPFERAVARSDELRGQARGVALASQDFAQALSLARARDEEEDAARGVDGRGRERDAPRLELLDPVGDDPRALLREGGRSRKERGRVAVVAHAEHDEVYARPGGVAEKL